MLNQEPEIDWQARVDVFEKDAVSIFREASYGIIKHSTSSRRVSKGKATIFLGHGRSAVWRVLRDYLEKDLGFKCLEFNSESAAGISTAQRLQDMADRADFAFLIMTAEDVHEDNTIHARENVVHEVGLFQGKLTFERAIVVLEDGCTEFSNIVGLGQIRFPKNDILFKADEIKGVLEREGFL